LVVSPFPNSQISNPTHVCLDFSSYLLYIIYQGSYFGPSFLIQMITSFLTFQCTTTVRVVLATMILLCRKTGHSDERLHRKSGHNHFIKNKFQHPRKASCMSCLFRSSTLLTSFMDSLSKTSRSDLKGKRYLWFLNFKIDIYRTLCKNHLSLSTIYVFEPMHFKAYLGKSQVYRCDKT